MSLKSGTVPQRRRGEALEAALLDAAWAEVTDTGYEAFTIDAVAARAGTSRAVLYRRWSSKQDLVHAAIGYAVGKDPEAPPDTGSLRGDVIAMLRHANRRRVRLAIQLLTQLGDFYRATGTSLGDVATLVQSGPNDLMDNIIERAVRRGEVLPGQISDRIARLPGDLFRYEIMWTLQPLTDETIEEIVDTIFLPLVQRGSAPMVQD